MVEKPEVLYGEVQGVVGYWYPEMDMDMWLKPILEKCDLWDQYAIYDNVIKENILVNDLITAYLKLDSVREFVLMRRDDIEMDMENFGMLKPVLSHFLERASEEVTARHSHLAP